MELNTKADCVPFRFQLGPAPRLPKSLKCMYFNARSIAKPGACDALSAYCFLNVIDVVFISETWLGPGVTNSELSFNGLYNVFRKDRDTRGGGVCILVNKKLSCYVLSLDEGPEAVGVDILTPVVLYGFYVAIYQILKLQLFVPVTPRN